MRKLDLSNYHSLVFDCDGVLLNSNQVKTQAFYQAARSYGELKAQALVDFHVANGGISRYSKFEFFLKELIGREQIDNNELGELLAVYAENVWQGLLSCEVAEGLCELREETSCSNWMVVSGGDQSELRQLFSKRQLDYLFDGGIFGSPDNKDTILSRELGIDNISKPAIFFGDSQYDFEAAKRAGLDFAFVSEWSESKFKFSDADYVISNLEMCVQKI